MNDLPEEVDELRFAVLDNSNPKEPDYFFIPLILLQSFNASALVLKIGEHTIRMPKRLADAYRRIRSWRFRSSSHLQV